MTIKLAGQWIVVRKCEGRNDCPVAFANKLSEAADEANKDWMKICDDKLLRYNVLCFNNTGEHHVADTGENLSYHIIYIPVN